MNPIELLQDFINRRRWTDSFTSNIHSSYPYSPQHPKIQSENHASNKGKTNGWGYHSRGIWLSKYFLRHPVSFPPGVFSLFQDLKASSHVPRGKWSKGEHELSCQVSWDQVCWFGSHVSGNMHTVPPSNLWKKRFQSMINKSKSNSSHRK